MIFLSDETISMLKHHYNYKIIVHEINHLINIPRLKIKFLNFRPYAELHAFLAEYMYEHNRVITRSVLKNIKTYKHIQQYLIESEKPMFANYVPDFI